MLWTIHLSIHAHKKDDPGKTLLSVLMLQTSWALLRFEYILYVLPYIFVLSSLAPIFVVVRWSFDLFVCLSAAGICCPWRSWWSSTWRINSGYDIFNRVSTRFIGIRCFLNFYDKFVLLTFFIRHYVNLQKVYQAKAEADILAMEQHVQNLLKKIGRNPMSISKMTIKGFCKNARKLTVSILRFCF